MEHIINTLNNIGSEYKPIPFWSWNDDLQPEELKGKTAVEVGELVHSMMAEDLGPDLVLQENT